MQVSHLVALLPPYHRNFCKRLVKSPELSMLDTGLMCHLLRLASPDDLHTHAMRGAVFETWVVSDVFKHRANRGLLPDLYLWRDQHGLEVDMVFERRGQLHSVECKPGATHASDWMDASGRWRLATGPEAGKAFVMYGGPDSHARRDHQVLSWRDAGAMA